MTEEKIIEAAERYGRLENIDHGIAWVIGEDVHLDRGSVVLFNDRQKHLWIPDNASTMLVVNVKEK